MSLRDLFQEIKTEQTQAFLPKTNSIIVKNIPEGNLDLHGVFPGAVDFVLQAKAKGITAVVTFKTPEEATQAVKKKVEIGQQKILPKLLVERANVKGKKRKATKGKKEKAPKRQRPAKKAPIIFEKLAEDEEYEDKIHVWKLEKKIHLTIKKNWDEIKAEAKLEVNPQRKEILNQEIYFLKRLLKLLEDHKWKEFQDPIKCINFPLKCDVFGDELLHRLRDELRTCVQEQIDVIRKAKFPPKGMNKTEAKFAREIRFLTEFHKRLSAKFKNKPKTKKKAKK